MELCFKDKHFTQTTKTPQRNSSSVPDNPIDTKHPERLFTICTLMSGDVVEAYL